MTKLVSGRTARLAALTPEPPAHRPLTRLVGVSETSFVKALTNDKTGFRADGQAGRADTRAANATNADKAVHRG